jgi:uncharacterized cupin superfamily protein
MPIDNHPRLQSAHRDMEHGHWLPFTWGTSTPGEQPRGELALIRTGSSSGDHQAGLWRTGAGLVGCAADGSCRFAFAAPGGDETLFILEGKATITVPATGRQHDLVPGSIVSQPKGVALDWAIEGRRFRALWVHWNSPQIARPRYAPVIAHVDDESAGWVPYEWIEPENGLPYHCGEMLFVRTTGSTGTLKVGIWRASPDPGSDETAPIETCQCGRCAGHRIGSARGVGDETMILLDGRSQIVDEDTGATYQFKAGDIIAVSEGLQGRWTSKARDMRKLFIVTNAKLPQAAE